MDRRNTPMSSELAQKFSTLTIPEGEIGLWWLGQSSLALRAGSTNLLIDPFLQPRSDRASQAPIAAEDCSWATVVACTHEHEDHFEVPTVETISRVAPTSHFVVPEPIVSMATDLGIAASRVTGVQPGTPVERGDVTIHAVPAVHGIHVKDAYTDGRNESNGLYRFLGYVVQAGGVTVYHAGDTIVFDGLVEALEPFHIDIALLPINGRSFFREQQDLVGNMGPRDAAELASQIDARVLIPMHYDAFPKNLGYPDLLVQIARNQYPDLSIMLPSRNRPFLYASSSSLDVA
jgi:L-ascorbate 6-phosphate lactonase